MLENHVCYDSHSGELGNDASEEYAPLLDNGDHSVHVYRTNDYGSRAAGLKKFCNQLRSCVWMNRKGNMSISTAFLLTQFVTSAATALARTTL